MDDFEEKSFQDIPEGHSTHSRHTNSSSISERLPNENGSDKQQESSLNSSKNVYRIPQKRNGGNKWTDRNVMDENHPKDKFKRDVSTPYNARFSENRHVGSNSNKWSERNFMKKDANHPQKDKFMHDVSTPRYPRLSENRHQERSMGFRFIEDLLKKDTEQGIMDLHKNYNGFLLTLNKKDLSENFIVLIVQLLEKICDVTFDAVKLKLLQGVFDSPFKETLLHYIIGLHLQSDSDRKNNKYFWDNRDEFWHSLFKAFHYLINVIPSYACQVLPKLVKSVNVAIYNIEQNLCMSVSTEIKDSFREIAEKVSLLEKDYEKKKKEESSRNDQDQEPPNDYRDIDIYPSPQELTNPHCNFLRKNVIEGQFKSIYDYLDIQFRLLREDFVAPLREGICSFLSEEKRRLQNVKIYRNVYFLNIEYVTNQDCYKVSFKSSMKRKFSKYEESRRFMFGSLVCFTRDNFKTILFGKVVGRDPKLLEESCLIIGFDTDQKISIDYKSPYLMVECSVYFEPYYHVLSVLKKFDFSSFPMEKYIIQVDNTPQPPKYLLPTTEYDVNEFTFTPLNWPKDHAFFSLNESQGEAYKAALTQEFAVIQGPPGTGKTFLGLKIAETLLKNKEAWYNKTPMLVICYTNHALDQFLEGLLPVIGHSIVRVGSQSKDKNLEQFNIRNKRHPGNSAVNAALTALRNCLINLKRISGYIVEINKFDSILDLNYFAHVAPEIPWLKDIDQFEQLAWLFFLFAPTSQASPSTRYEHVQEITNDEDPQKTDKGADTEDNDEHNLDNIDDDVFEGICYTRFSTVTDLNTIHDECRDLEEQLAYVEKHPELTDLEKFDQVDQINSELDEKYYISNILQDMLKVGKERKFKQINIFKNCPHDMNRISFEDRWNLYFSLLMKYYKDLQRKQKQLNEDFQRLYREYSELRDMEDVDIMKDVLVVGMTTTGAARLRSSLQALKSPIVIVEEAAEVLEAHIVTSLTSSCQHLILIGDHQQLKPSTAHFTIEKKFHLGVSLFERMVHNGIQCYTLDVQHRMRPEISALIAPRIYPNLKNHYSVFERPDIAGVEKPVYFIDHTIPEEACEDESKKNSHEASFLINLARHLVLNGHEAEEITILAAYLGQFYEMQWEKKKYLSLLNNVRIAVLDNYQGEESEIILLSLVRSNNENRIGFLNIENRVCVALSRARTGFYMIGNMEHLVRSNTTNIWPCVKETLEKADMIGPHLILKCQLHPYNITPVKCADDFSEISEGGCKDYCNKVLACGHKCPSRCHIMDQDHSLVKCKEKCGRKLCESSEDHLCRKMCSQNCEPCDYPIERKLNCGHTVTMKCSVDPTSYKCYQPLETTLPCGHIADKPCGIDAKEFSCPHPCDTKVEPCGHACERMCHIYDDPDHINYQCSKQCERYSIGCLEESGKHKCHRKCYEKCSKCEISVERMRSCSHFYTVPCSHNIEDMECTKPCKKLLDCNHLCSNNCSEPCGPCKMLVEKPIPECGHITKIKCYEVPNRKLCMLKCPLKLPCGHNCIERCCDPCTAQCKEIISCNIISPCGHIVTRIECYLKSDLVENDRRLLAECTSPCTEVLLCGHQCSGSCSGCYQGRMHKKCNKKCETSLVCSHKRTEPCGQACSPCMNQCMYRCKHGKCRRKCGDACTPCSQSCVRNCQHQRCRNRCFQICSVGPCEQPCSKRLRCGHSCMGFCSDYCPKICFECNKDEIREIFTTFAIEDEKTARLVQLADCGHIVEDSAMKRYLEQNSEEIKMIACPLCKIPIITTRRYSDYVKRCLGDIYQVKIKLFGSPKENMNKIDNLSQKVDKVGHALCYYSDGAVSLNKIVEHLKLQKKHQNLTAMNLNYAESIYQIVVNIKSILRTYIRSPMIGHETMNICIENLRFICNDMLTPLDGIQNQEVSDITNELKRFHRLAQLASISYYLLTKKVEMTTEIELLYVQCKSKLSGFRKFTDEAYEEVGELIEKLYKLLPDSVLPDNHVLPHNQMEIEQSNTSAFTNDLRRLHCSTQLASISYRLTREGEMTTEIKLLYAKCKSKLSRLRKFTDETYKEFVELMEKLYELLPDYIVPHNQVKIEKINSMMKNASGYWYKCPEGHPYYSEERNAIQTFKCNECSGGDEMNNKSSVLKLHDESSQRIVQGGKTNTSISHSRKNVRGRRRRW